MSRKKRKKLSSLRKKEKFQKRAEKDPKRTTTNKINYYSKQLRELTEEYELEAVTTKVKRGGLYIERYVKDADGNVLESIMGSPTDLDNVLHIFFHQKQRHGVRLVYAKIADGVTRESNDGNTTSVSDIDTNNIRANSKKIKCLFIKTWVFKKVKKPTL